MESEAEGLGYIASSRPDETLTQTTTEDHEPGSKSENPVWGKTGGN
jgi:hypothetical protein